MLLYTLADTQFEFDVEREKVNFLIPSSLAYDNPRNIFEILLIFYFVNNFFKSAWK